MLKKLMNLVMAIGEINFSFISKKKNQFYAVFYLLIQEGLIPNSSAANAQENFVFQTNFPKTFEQMLTSLLYCVGILEKWGDRFQLTDPAVTYIQDLKKKGFLEYSDNAIEIDLLLKAANRPGPSASPFWDEEDLYFTDKNMHERRFRLGQTLSRFISSDEQPKKILDVGGACASTLVGILKNRTNLIGFCYDQPRLKEIASDRILRSGMQDRLSFYSGNFLKEELPAPMDYILISYVLHDWGDRIAAQIIEKSKRALNHGGQLFIVEAFFNEDGVTPAEAAFQNYCVWTRSSHGRQFKRSEVEAMLLENRFERLSYYPNINEFNACLMIAQKP